MKKIAIIIVIVLILLIGGTFLFKEIKGQDVEQGKIISKCWSIPSQEYNVGQDIEYNGLNIQIPENWIVKQYEKEINIVSPESEFDQFGYIIFDSLEKGSCLIGVWVNKCQIYPDITTNAQEIRYRISQIQNNLETIEGYSVVKVDSELGLQKITKDQDQIIDIEIQVPQGDDTVYTFGIGPVFSQDCIGEFNKFLETISIK